MHLPQTGYAVTLVANVAGLGEPPFLSYGVDPNLLMVIDNSGSMLDMAYQDKEEYTGVVTDDNNKDVTYTYEKTCSDDGYLKEQDEQSNWVIKSKGVCRIL